MTRPRRFRVRSTALVAGAILATAGCGSSDSVSDSSAPAEVGGPPDQQWSVEDAAYVLPTEIPDGWTLGVATLRVEQGEMPEGDFVRFSDYTVTWVLEENAGLNRTDVNHDGPDFWINSGSRYYEDVYLPAFADDSEPSTPPIGEYSDATPIDRDGDGADLMFRVGCCLVALGSSGISDDVLRSIAGSMIALEPGEWQSELGTRLLVDDQT